MESGKFHYSESESTLLDTVRFCVCYFSAEDRCEHVHP